jgi:hypothetical protein
MQLEFPNLSTILTVVKMMSQVKKTKCMLWFHKCRSAVTVQRRFCMVFGREMPTKMLICKLIRLAAFVKEKALGDAQSLKLMWMQFVWLSFTVHTNQSGMLLKIKHTPHSGAENSAETFEI